MSLNLRPNLSDCISEFQKKLKKNSKILAVSTGQGLLLTLIILFSFILFEPSASRGDFMVSQSVTTEIGFVTGASDITMSPSIHGKNGGTAYGSTQFSIRSNSSTGFKVTIQASTTDGSMVGIASTTSKISGYTTLTPGIPDYDFTVRNASDAAFGYTVDATTTTDVPLSFRHNGSTCGTGATNGGLDNCWIAATSTAFTIMNRTIPTTDGIPASSTIAFRVTLNPNPSQPLINDTYVATTTLTVTAN